MSPTSPVATPTPPEPAKTTEERGAVVALLLGALAFSLMAVCVKRLVHRIPVAEIVLGRALLNVAMSGWMLHSAGVNPWGRRRGWLAVRGITGSLALYCVFAALAVLPLATATLIQYLYPSLTALLAWWWLGEPIGRRVALALALGWLGVTMVLRPGTADAAPAWGVLLALAGALLTALAYVSVRQLGRSEHPLVIVLWFPLMAVPLSLPLVLLEPVLPTAGECLWLLGVGLFTQLGQLGLTHGLTRLPAGRATALGYAQVGFAALWGWSVFGEGLAAQTLLGGALILAAAALCRR
ncbi:MAG: membrane protein [Cyanobium sp. CACIAM 14]|nr:MAG: membrane protein [Cyanobium sp. CACIAM 14]